MKCEQANGAVMTAMLLEQQPTLPELKHLLCYLCSTCIHVKPERAEKNKKNKNHPFEVVSRHQVGGNYSHL